MFRRKRSDASGHLAEPEAAGAAFIPQGTDAPVDVGIDEYDDVEDAREREDVDSSEELLDNENDEFADDYVEAPRDPAVSWMTLVSLLLLVVVIVAAGSVVYFILALRGAPRTAVEREIIAAEADASAEPTMDNYRLLAYSYLSAGRYRDALTATARGRKVQDGSTLDLLEADILRMQGQHERAVKMYEKAAKRNEAEFIKAVRERAKKGIAMPPGREVYVSIMIGKGESLFELAKTKEASKAFEEAVKWDSTNAYALMRSGDAYAKLGDDKKAKAAYEEALRYIPDYEPAQSGLDRLDTGAKE